MKPLQNPAPRPNVEGMDRLSALLFAAALLCVALIGVYASMLSEVLRHA